MRQESGGHVRLVFVLFTMIGLITPPPGITTFIACQLAGITVNEFTRLVWRPFFAPVLAMIVCALWPGLVLFLPADASDLTPSRTA